MEYSLQEINNKWLVHYNLGKYGWKSQGIFETKIRAEKFIEGLKNRN